MRREGAALLLAASTMIVGCGTSPTSSTALPPGSYSATYEVPVPAGLAAAARYPVAEVNWRVAADGTARLAYNLPLGLVGRTVRVDFSGTFDATAQTATLSGVAGTSQCTLAGTDVACAETMRGLLPLEADLAVVAAVAALEYAGPAQDRLDVAQRFIGDPIGIVHADLSSGVAEPEPIVDDKKK